MLGTKHCMHAVYLIDLLTIIVNGFHLTAIISAQLTVLTGPEALVSSSSRVVEGGNIHSLTASNRYTCGVSASRQWNAEYQDCEHTEW